MRGGETDCSDVLKGSLGVKSEVFGIREGPLFRYRVDELRESGEHQHLALLRGTDYIATHTLLIDYLVHFRGISLDNCGDLFGSLRHLLLDMGYKTTRKSEVAYGDSVFIPEMDRIEGLSCNGSAYNELVEYRGIEAALVKVDDE